MPAAAPRSQPSTGRSSWENGCGTGCAPHAAPPLAAPPAAHEFRGRPPPGCLPPTTPSPPYQPQRPGVLQHVKLLFHGVQWKHGSSGRAFPPAPRSALTLRWDRKAPRTPRLHTPSAADAAGHPPAFLPDRPPVAYTTELQASFHSSGFTALCSLRKQKIASIHTHDGEHLPVRVTAGFSPALLCVAEIDIIVPRPSGQCLRQESVSTVSRGRGAPWYAWGLRPAATMPSSQCISVFFAHTIFRRRRSPSTCNVPFHRKHQRGKGTRTYRYPPPPMRKGRFQTAASL